MTESTAKPTSILEEAQAYLRRCHVPAEPMAEGRIQDACTAFLEAWRLRFSDPAFSESDLLAAFAYATHKRDVFLQLLLQGCSTECLVLAWCMLRGATIGAARMDFRAMESFSLEVTLRGRTGEAIHFRTTEPGDLALLRHVTTLQVDGKPVLDGLYP